MKKTLILDKELVSAGLDTSTIDGGTNTATCWPLCTSDWSCGPDNCPSCGSCSDEME